MALFYPATTPTRRKRRQIHWAGVAAVLAAVFSASMISQVYTLHRERYEKRLEELHGPAKNRTTVPAAQPRDISKPHTPSLSAEQRIVTLEL